MSLFTSLAEHLANPPQTWKVEKAGTRTWKLVTATGADLGERFDRKKDAEAARDIGGASARLYETECRWYAGLPVSVWQQHKDPQPAAVYAATWERWEAATAAGNSAQIAAAMTLIVAIETAHPELTRTAATDEPAADEQPAPDDFATQYEQAFGREDDYDAQAAAAGDHDDAVGNGADEPVYDPAADELVRRPAGTVSPQVAARIDRHAQAVLLPYQHAALADLDADESPRYPAGMLYASPRAGVELVDAVLTARRAELVAGMAPATDPAPAADDDVPAHVCGRHMATMHPRENPLPAHAALGTWYDCPSSGCWNSVLVPSAELLAQLDEQRR